jgi:hypothetical protein
LLPAHFPMREPRVSALGRMGRVCVQDQNGPSSTPVGTVKLGKDPVPHPDDIAINERTLEVRFSGPENHDEKAQWDQMLARKAEFKKKCDELRGQLRRDSQYAASIEQDIAQSDYIYRLIDQTIPDDNTRRQPDSTSRSGGGEKFDKSLKRPTMK